MQLSEITADGEWRFQLSLHPQITVVTGLDPSRRRWLAQSIAAVLRGDPDSALAVFVDVGEPIQLVPDEVELLEIPGNIDVTLEAADLPGARIVPPSSPTPQEAPDDPSGVASHREPEVEPVADPEPDISVAGEPPPQPVDRAALAEHRKGVAAARAALQSFRLDGDQPPREAIELLAEWREVSARWRQAEVDRDTDERKANLRERLEVARVEMAAAEQYAKPLYVDPQDQDLLEAAHKRVIEAQERMDRRFARASARRQLAGAQAVERGILQRIGCDSYDAYLMRTSSGLGDLAARDRVELAQQELLEAEVAWELVAINDSPEVRQLRRERQAVLRRVRSAVGSDVVDDDIEAALLALREPLDDHLERQALQEALDQAGVVVHRSLEDEAALWLAEMDVVLAEPEEPEEPEESGQRAVVGESAGVGGPPVDRLVPTAAEAAPETLRSRARAPLEVPPDVDLSQVDGGEAEVYVLSRIAAQRVVGGAGSLPLVMDNPFQGLQEKTLASLLGLLERVAPAIQVILLTDEPQVVEWGNRLSADLGTVRLFASHG